MDYRHTAFNTAAGSTLPAPQQTNVAPASNCRKLLAGRAVTLRAKQLSVLRIVRGRVWATLTDAGCYSRVLAGDHFLSRGQSLTLLPGQELVMESFNGSASSATATAHFNWETLGLAASAGQDARPAQRAIGMGVRQPLRDLRQALVLVAGACGRLVRGLVHGAVTAFFMLPNAFAINFIALRDRICCRHGSFGITKRPAAVQSAGSSAH